MTDTPTPPVSTACADAIESMPSVTCVIGAYNHAGYVQEALDSAFAQTYPNLRIVIYDDASTDGTPEVIRKHLADVGRDDVLFVAHEQNKGLCASLNEMVDLVDSDYVAFISADDIQEPDRFELQVARLAELGRDYGLCYSDMRRVDEVGRVVSESYFGRLGVDEPPSGDLFEPMLDHMAIATPSVLMRTDVLREAGTYDGSLKSEDYDMFLRISRLTKCAYVPTKTIRYRVISDSLWHQLEDDRVRFLTDERRTLAKHLDAPGEAGQIAARRVAENTKRLYLMGETPSESAAQLMALPAAARRGRTRVYLALTRLRVPGKWLAAQVRAFRRGRDRVRR